MSNTLSGTILAFNGENCTCSTESSTVTTFITITMTDRSVATTTSFQQDEDDELQGDTSTTLVLEDTTSVAVSSEPSTVPLPTTRPGIEAPAAGPTLISTTATVESSSLIASSVPDTVPSSTSLPIISSEPSPTIDPVDNTPSETPSSSAPNSTSEVDFSSTIPFIPIQTTDSIINSTFVSASIPVAPSTSTSVSLYVPPTSPDETPVFAIGSDITVDIPQTTEIVTTTKSETPPEETTDLISQAPPTTSPTVSETEQDATTEMPETTSVPSEDVDSSFVIISVPRTTSASISVTSTSSSSKTTSDAVSTTERDNRKTTDVAIEPSFTTLVIPEAPPAANPPEDTPVGDQAGSAGSDGDSNINVVDQGSSSSPPTPVLVGSVVGALAGAAMMAFLFWFCWRRRRGRKRRSSFLTPLSFPGSGDEEKSGFGRKSRTRAVAPVTHMTEATPFSAGNHGSRGRTPPSRAHGNHQPQPSTVLSMDDSQFDPDNQPVRVSGGSNPFLDTSTALGPSDPVVPPNPSPRDPFSDANYIDSEPRQLTHQSPAAFMVGAPISKRESVPNRPRTRPPSINTNANFRSEYLMPCPQDGSFDAHRNNIRSDQFDLEADNQHVSGSSYMYPMPLNVPIGPTHPPSRPHDRRSSWGASSSVYSSGVSDTVSEWDGPNNHVPPLPRESGPLGYGRTPFMTNGGRQVSPGVGKAW